MSTLLNLPIELLIEIFGACSIAGTLHLAATNRRLRQIWLENADAIIERILKPVVQPYEDAVQLAVLEARYEEAEHPGPQRGPHAWLPLLLCNADFAQAVDSKHIAFASSKPERNSERTGGFTSKHAAYYLIRRLVLSYRHPELQPSLQMLSTEQLKELYDRLDFMCECMDQEEADRQGISKSEDDEAWVAEDELCANPCQPGWDFAEAVIFGALVERAQAEKSQGLG